MAERSASPLCPPPPRASPTLPEMPPASAPGTITSPLTIYDAAAKFQPRERLQRLHAGELQPEPADRLRHHRSRRDAGDHDQLDGDARRSRRHRRQLLERRGPCGQQCRSRQCRNGLDHDGTAVRRTWCTRLSPTARSTPLPSVNAATGVISATQNYFAAFNPTLLSTTASGTPPTYTARYNGTTLAIVSALYSDDNTNSFVINNAGKITATGNYAAAYYGRRRHDDRQHRLHREYRLDGGRQDLHGPLGARHLRGRRPSRPSPAATRTRRSTTCRTSRPTRRGFKQGSLAVTDTSATTVTNKAGGTIMGDILVLDTNPLVTAAADAKGASAAARRLRLQFRPTRQFDREPGPDQRQLLPRLRCA